MGMIIHTDEEINEKYIKGEVRIVTEQGRFQLTTIENIVEGEDYILNPEYQRRHRWNNERKSKLIESFIMNVPVPPIFLYEKDYSVYEVMDGLQRLTAIYDFYTDRFSLVGLEEWGELNGLVYSQLPIQVKKGIDRRYLSSIILLKETAKTDKEAQRLKQMVFERINSGGEKLEPQETRNALYNGELNQLCIKIARDKYFCRMWGIPEQINEEDEQELDKELIENPLYKKMSDVELILRFFAFRHLDKWEKMTLERFLDYFLKKGNLFDENVIKQYEKLFKETIQFVYEVLGENAFCLYRVRNEDWKWYDRPTKVVFDPIMHVFSQNLENKDILISKKEEIQRDLKKFYMDNYNDFGGRNTGKTHVILRIEKMNTFIKRYLEAAE
ncbi:hypothetical protein BW425_07915 [Bacillus pseudomycoides]|uniref:GmrSD restriction endonucleases N-terminal domain-containing protein n=4 Tax=Bacillaceae TaxID=186817 RepID=A0A1Y3MQQ7_9BACI|nr:hypothetical protein BW425_07915 [Bacillus pseudomycoides]